MNKKTLLVINKEWPYYDSLKSVYTLHFRKADTDASPYQQVDEIIAWLEQSNISIDGVVGYLDGDMVIASLIAKRLGLAGTNPKAVYRAQNKAEFSKIMLAAALPYPQTEEVNIASDDLPELGYPLFLKPDKGSLSAFSYLVESEEEYRKIRTILKNEKNVSQPLFNHFFSTYDEKYTELEHWFVAQSVSSGVPYNIDGLVINGVVHFLGVTKSVTTPDGKSFLGFEYPADVSDQFNKDAEEMARKVLSAIEFDNSGFNIEFFAQENGEFAIIELNSRLTPGYYALFEQQFESSCFEMLFEAALGNTPNLEFKALPQKAVSYPLRVFTDRIVEKVPTQERFKELEKELGLVEVDIWVLEGERLSDHRQDAYSFRYGFVYIAGASFEEIFQKKLEFLKILEDELALKEIEV